MQKKGSIDRLRAKYPGYYQKKSNNWKKEKEIRDLAIKKKAHQITQSTNEDFVAYFNSIDSMNKNIDKLFKLL